MYLSLHLALIATWLTGCQDDSSSAGKDDAGTDLPGDKDGGTSDSGTSEPAALDFAALDTVIDSFLQDKMLAGATAVVVDKTRGNVHERGYGSFDKARISLIASTSKVLSVGILMALSDAKKLDIDSPISGYLSSWGMYKSNLTTAMLVSNSSGLVSLTANPYYAPYICQYTESGTLSACAQMIYTAMDDADRKPPDTAFSYGGGPWQLSGGIAEVVSGKKWTELVKDTYVTPCGTDSLGYTNQFGASGTTYPTNFNGVVDNLPKTENPSIEGGAYIAAGDYGKILLMHLRGGMCDDKRVLSEAAVARMQADRIKMAYNGSTTSDTLQGYGMGWWVDRANPGVVVDPGAYGAIAWLDNTREYAAYIAIEATSALGSELLAKARPAVEGIFDAAK
jgi:CubicO group peptidase (beta-lactamase class C family)